MRPITRGPARAIGRLVSVGLLVAALAACGQDQGGQEADAEVGQAIDEALAPLETELAELDERLRSLEASPGGVEPADPATPGVTEVTTTKDYAAIPQPEGRVLTLEGPISSVVGDRAFTLGAEDIGGRGLLVFSPETLAGLIVEEGAVVRVTGMVRDSFSLDEAAEVGVEITDPESYRDLEGVEWIDATVVSAAPDNATQQ